MSVKRTNVPLQLITPKSFQKELISQISREIIEEFSALLSEFNIVIPDEPLENTNKINQPRISCELSTDPFSSLGKEAYDLLNEIIQEKLQKMFQPSV
jgi:hypothetical protein